MKITSILQQCLLFTLLSSNVTVLSEELVLDLNPDTVLELFDWAPISAYKLAISRGEIELVKLLIQKRGVPDNLPTLIYRSIRAPRNSLEIFTLLTSYRFSPTELPYLDEAIGWENVSIVKVLLEKHKISAFTIGYGGFTALQNAHHTGNKVIIELLERRAKEEMLEKIRLCS